MNVFLGGVRVHTMKIQFYCLLLFMSSYYNQLLPLVNIDRHCVLLFVCSFGSPFGSPHESLLTKSFLRISAQIWNMEQEYRKGLLTKVQSTHGCVLFILKEFVNVIYFNVRCIFFIHFPPHTQFQVYTNAIIFEEGMF